MCQHRKSDQRGVVALLVSIIIMIILTLIAVAFSRLMAREQEQALDRQLSAQAYYAAETAINDAVQRYIAGDSSPQGQCFDSDGESGWLSENEILTNNGDDVLVDYSCVTLNDNPTALRFESIQQDTYTTTELNSEGGSLSTVDIWWEENEGSTNFGSQDVGLNPNPSSYPTDRPGALRVEFTPKGNDSDPFYRDVAIEGMKVFYIYPTTASTGGVGWDTANPSLKLLGTCANAAGRERHCNARITGIPGGSYIVRLRSIYNDNAVTLEGLDSSGSQLGFEGAQLVVDATGRTNGVVRRVRAQVQLDSSSSRLVPVFGFQALDGVCKDIRYSDDVDYNCY